MRDHIRRAADVKSRPSSEGEPPDPGQERSWKVVVSSEFLDARASPMSHRARYVVQALDGNARLNPFCWHGNEELARQTGMSLRSLQETLDELEGAGWIRRIYTGGKKPDRLGIVMRRRVGPGTPFADTPERLAIVEQAVRSKWRPTEADPGRWMEKLGLVERNKVRSGGNAPTRKSAHTACENPHAGTSPRVRKSALSARDKPHAPACGNPRQNKDVVVKKNEVKKESASRDADSASPFNDNDKSRPRKVLPSQTRPMTFFTGHPIPPHIREAREKQAAARRAALPNPATPMDPAEIRGLVEMALPNVEPDPEVPEQVGGAVDRAMVDVKQAASMAGEPINAVPSHDSLPDGIRRFLDTVGPDRRAKLWAMSLGKRREILSVHSEAFQADLAEFQSREIDRIKVPVEGALAVATATTVDLIEAVAGGDAVFIVKLAESLCRDFGTEKDRDLWGAIHALCGQLWKREVSADHVLDAYRQAMGPEAKNRGAVFTHALKAHGWRPG